MRKSWVSILCGAAAMLIPAFSGLQAKDHVLTIGGGYSPSGNQVSLEKNIFYFQRVLKDLGLGTAPHDIFFSKGKGPGRDLIQEDPDKQLPKINDMMALVFSKERGLRQDYRSHQLENLSGGSNRADVTKWFNTTGPTLKKGDRLILYITAHGGKASGKDPQNTLLYMWNNQNMTMKEFTGLLDKLDPQVQVVMVMVQCFSGGFANVIFKDGDQKNGLSPAARCGFYATVHDRPAAGCTPDIREENYKEYSTSFWAAVYGKTRLGKQVPKPDYDGDGQVSYNEAHSYALINSDTIDISIRTSDAFLRAYSKTKDDKLGDQLYSYKTEYEQIHEAAGPCEKAVLDELSKSLNMDMPDRVRKARHLATEVMTQRGKLNGERGGLVRKYEEIRGSFRKMVTESWPEIANPYHPLTMKMMTDKAEGEKMVSMIEKHASWPEFKKLAGKIRDLDKQSEDMEHKWVKYQRLVYVAESVALAHNLKLVATPDLQKQYERLRTMENATLTGGSIALPDFPASPKPAKASTEEKQPEKTEPAEKTDRKEPAKPASTTSKPVAP